MESAKLADLIQYSAKLCGRTDMQIVVGVLKSAGKSKVQSIMKNLGHHLKTTTPQTTAVSTYLFQLSQLMQLAAAKGAHTDLIAVAHLSERFGAQSVDALINLANTPKPPPIKRGPSKGPADLREIADQLLAAGRSKSAFEAVLAKAEKLKKPELLELANRYLGYKVPSWTKADALKAIRARHLQDALEDSREEGLKAMVPQE